MTIATKDRAAGLRSVIKVGHTDVARYDPGLALKVCEGILEGGFLKDILEQPGMPVRSTWYRWLLLYPELKEMYERARQLSAEGIEEDMLSLARTMIRDGLAGLTPLRLDEIKVGFTQGRWSAARRDPGKFAERPAVQVAIPIQINTSLDLDGTGKGGIGADANIYHVTVTRDVAADAAAAAEAEDAEFESLPPEAEADPLAVPAKPKMAAIRPPAKPRRRKGHKTPGQIAATIMGRGNAGRKRGPGTGRWKKKPEGDT